MILEAYQKFIQVFKLGDIQRARKLEDEIVLKIEDTNLESDLNAISKAALEEIISVRITLALWKSLISNGEVRSSKKIYHQLLKKIYENKNQSALEELISYAEKIYPDYEILETKIFQACLTGNSAKLESFKNERVFYLNPTLFRLMTYNFEFWSLHFQSIEGEILLNKHRENGKWLYKNILKLLFEVVLRTENLEKIEKYLEEIKIIENELESHDSSSDLSETVEGDEAVLNKIKLLLSIGKKSSALKLSMKIDDEELKEKIKLIFDSEKENGKITQEKNSYMHGEAIDQSLVKILEKFEREINKAGNISDKMSFLNFCLSSEMYESASIVLSDLLNRVENENLIIDLMFMKVQMYIKLKKHTEALLLLNDMISSRPLKNEEKQLADWYFKKVIKETNAP